MPAVYASDQSLAHVTLECPDNEDIRRVLDAIEVVTDGWLAPLGVGFRLAQCDPDTFDERPLVPPRHVLVRGPSFAGGVAPEGLGPTLADGSRPAAIRASLTRLHIALYWDLWKAELDRGVDAAAALGWTREA